MTAFPALFIFSRLCHASRVCAALLCLFSAAASQAETLDRLYDVLVPVADQSDKARRLASMDALDQVLVRASGQSLSALSANAVIQQLRLKPEDYLLEYSYGSAREAAPVKGAARKGGAATPPGAQLSVRFSPSAIRGLLARAALPLWPRQRPTVLLWWQLEQQAQPQWAPTETLRSEAARRGVPLVLPMNDLQDKLAQEPLWSQDAEALAQVAQRYGIPAVLLGRARESANGWQGQWLFYYQGQVTHFPVAPDALSPAPWLEVQEREELEIAGIDAAVQVLLQHYGVAMGGSGSQVELTVSEVSSFDAYSAVLRHLQGLESVRAVTLRSAQQHTLHYHLVFDGSLPALRALLVLDGLLVEASGEAAPAGSEMLRYRFARH